MKDNIKITAFIITGLIFSIALTYLVILVSNKAEDNFDNYVGKSEVKDNKVETKIKDLKDTDKLDFKGKQITVKEYKEKRADTLKVFKGEKKIDPNDFADYIDTIEEIVNLEDCTRGMEDVSFSPDSEEYFLILLNKLENNQC